MTTDQVQSDLMALSASRSVDVRVFSRVEANELAAGIREEFGDGRLESDPLWETLNESQAYFGKAADDQVKQRLKGLPGPLLLLIEDWHGYSALGISTGAQLLSLLEQSYKFSWYITDLGRTFVLCRNDHDVVIFCER
jgi:hypothetical protein